LSSIALRLGTALSLEATGVAQPAVSTRLIVTTGPATRGAQGPFRSIPWPEEGPEGLAADSSLMSMQQDQALHAVGRLCRVQDPARVRDYLRVHPELAAVLPSVCDDITELLQPESRMLLELYQDPETDDFYLTLSISVPGSRLKHASDILDDIVRKHADTLARSDGWLLLMPAPRAREVDP